MTFTKILAVLVSAAMLSVMVACAADKAAAPAAPAAAAPAQAAQAITYQPAAPQAAAAAAPAAAPLPRVSSSRRTFQPRHKQLFLHPLKLEPRAQHSGEEQQETHKAGV